MKYAVLSDLHFHAWSQFSSIEPDGVNSRLRLALNEFERAADVLKRAGGDTMFIAGDVFHTRGTIDPEVLNPVRDAFKDVMARCINIYIIPGNHDLKSSDTRKLSSAIQNLEQDWVVNYATRVINEPVLFVNSTKHKFAFVPWCSNNETLLARVEALTKVSDFDRDVTLFIHAGIDGVLSGMPAHGLTAAKLASYGFDRVFAGHYHNHADMGSGVYSVGATTHQTWSDIGTRAGFLIVDADKGTVQFNDTHAPKFVDISGLSEDDMELECGGNYVRYRGAAMAQADIQELRNQLIAWGALGVSIEVPRMVVATRGPAVTTGMTLAQSLDKFVDESTSIPAHVDRAAVKRRAAEVLIATQAVVEEA